jgi:hypothetical protein
MPAEFVMRTPDTPDEAGAMIIASQQAFQITFSAIAAHHGYEHGPRFYDLAQAIRTADRH